MIIQDSDESRVQSTRKPKLNLCQGNIRDLFLDAQHYRNVQSQAPFCNVRVKSKPPGREHRGMDSTKDMWRRRRDGGLGSGHRPMSSFSQRDGAEHFKLPDDQLAGTTIVGTGLAVHHEADAAVLPISRGEDVLELRSSPMSTGQIGDSNLSSYAANASSTETETSTGYNVSFHKCFSEDKWEVEPLNDMNSSDNSNYEILPSVHQGTESEANNWSAVLPKICETGSSSTDYFSDPDGQGDAPEAANQIFVLNNPQSTNSVNPINNLAADYSPREQNSDLFCSATWTIPAQEWPLEDDLMIYNLPAKQWQDELIFYKHQQAFAQEDPVANPTGVHEGWPDLKEHLSRIPKSEDHVRKSCVKTMSDIDVATESFSFWPEETPFYSCPTSPSMWPGSSPVLHHQGSHSCRGNTTTYQTLNDAEFSLLTDTLQYTISAGKPGVEGEACYSSGTWFESCGELSIYSMSRRGEVVDPISTNVYVDKRSSICQGISADQETTEMQQSVFPDSLELPQEQDNNQSGDSAVACLQEHASDLLLHNSKRDRTNSIEMLAKPTSALRQKKQKDEEISEGRLRGTPICTDPNLYYSLAAVQNLLKDFHGSAGFTLKAKELNPQRPKIADLLDAELETLCIGDNLGPENKSAVFAVLKRGRGNQQAATDSDLVQQILDLKMRLVPLLEESRFQESSTLSQLKDTVSRYAFLFPTSATDTFTKRLLQSNQYLELESVVCKNFRESKIFRRSSPSTASSSSRHLSKEYSSDEASVPSVCANVRGQIPVEPLGEGSAGTPPPPPSAERSERTRITSRRDLSGARGNLPRVAAEFMRKWLFKNFANPNPSREEKLSIANQFNITEKQVTNHFVNLRARKYRPLLRSLHEDSRPEDKQNGQGEKTEEEMHNQMGENVEEMANPNEANHSTRDDPILERRH